MRADEFLEATFGTSPKRKPRTGARPPRGHIPVPRYHSKGSEQGSVGEPTNRPDDARSVLENPEHLGMAEGSKESLHIGDPVIITGNVQFKGKTGDIVDFGKDNRFVIVDLYNYGRHSFHSSDVSYNDYADSDDEQEYQQSVAEGSLEEYGDTARGQKMLAKVHHRAADRVTSKQADKDPVYARKAQQTQDRAWDRLAVKEQGVAEDQPVDSDGYTVDQEDAGEYDYEGDQAKDQLQTIVAAARKLNGMLDDNENMPEWVQMKITKATDYLDTAADYVAANKAQAEPMAEAEPEKIGGRHDPADFDDMVSRLKKLAGMGPMRTVYNPNTRRYRNVPTAQQPGDKK